MSAAWEERAQDRSSRSVTEAIDLGVAAQRRLESDTDLRRDTVERRLERQAHAAQDLIDREQDWRHAEDRNAAHKAWDAAERARFVAETRYRQRRSALRIAYGWVALGWTILGLLHAPDLVHVILGLI